MINLQKALLDWLVMRLAESVAPEAAESVHRERVVAPRVGGQYAQREGRVRPTPRQSNLNARPGADLSTVRIASELRALGDSPRRRDVMPSRSRRGATIVKPTCGVRNPASPRVVGQLITTEMERATGVDVANGHAYVAGYGTDHLAIVSLADHANPQQVAALTDSRLWSPEYVRASGSHVFVTADFEDALVSVNVSDPTSPFIAGIVRDGVLLDEAFDLAVEGDYAYVPSHGFDGHYLTIVDVSDPTAPSIVGNTTMRDTTEQLHVKGGYAYVATDGHDEQGLTIFDVSNPASPFEAAWHDLSDLEDVFVRGVRVIGKYAYVGATAPGVVVLDVSDPTAPTRVRAALAGRVRPRRMFQCGSEYLYAIGFDTATEGTENIVILQLVSPGQPKLVGHVSRDDVGGYDGWHLHLASDFLVMTLYDGFDPGGIAVVK